MNDILFPSETKLLLLFLEWFYLFRKQNHKNKLIKNIDEFLIQASKSSDFKTLHLDKPNIELFFFSTLIDEETLNHFLLLPLQEHSPFKNLNDVIKYIPISEIHLCSENPEQAGEKIRKGHILIRLKSDKTNFALVNVKNSKRGLRENNDTENEFSVVGPKLGLIEDIETNMKLLRQQFSGSKLIFEELTLGSMTTTRVVIGYIEDITNSEHVNTVRQRLRDLDLDFVETALIDQTISDHSNTPFPLFLSTERVDRVTYTLLLGQVIIICDGSPYVITGPSTFFDFFISPEDYYLPWIVGSFFRIIRLFGVFFSVFATPLYVAVLTHHYVIIPKDLLGPIIESRVNVPFPPFLEVIFLEITIELLREAGARLPTKVGQTLGIVGGIVIGQASVEAALSSNVLLIIVALSALASFTTPIFKMANTIRLLRFPLVLLAAGWGGFGIIAGFTLMLGHLMRLKSFGTPYLAPIYPFRITDFRDGFIRSPFRYTTTRPSFLRPKKKRRYQVNEGKDEFDDE